MKPKTRTYLVTVAEMAAWLLGILAPGPILLFFGFMSAPKGCDEIWIAIGFGLRILGAAYAVFSVFLAIRTLFFYLEEFETIRDHYEAYVRQNRPSWDYDEDEELKSKTDSQRLLYLEKDFKEFQVKAKAYFVFIMLALFFIGLLMLLGIVAIWSQDLGIPDFISLIINGPNEHLMKD